MLQKWKLALGLTVIFAATILIGGCGSTDVGVLDVNKVMKESPKVKQLQVQLDAKGKDLSDKLAKDKATLSPEEFQKRQEAAYGEFLKAKQDLEGNVDASLKQALEQVAKDKKLSVIIYKNAAPYGGVDVTEDVLQKMQ